MSDPTASSPLSRHGRSLVIRAWLELLLYDLLHGIGGFRLVHRCVERTRCRRQGQTVDVANLCGTVDIASIWYFKSVRCLQRSVAGTRLLRRAGIDAQLVIAFRPMPINSHAWIEVDGTVVNDHDQYRRKFVVLDRL